jgi:CHAD domain-containing protein
MDAPELSESKVAALPPPPGGVSASAGQTPAAAPLLDFEPVTLLAATPRTPRRPPAQTPAPWHFPTTVGPFLANALRGRWEAYRAQVKRCRQEFSEETVHELRVATRRLIAQLVMLDCITPGTPAESVRRSLKRRLKALGDLRDTHVRRLFFERQSARFPELILVRDFLRREERRLEKSAKAKVKRFKTAKLGRRVLRLSEDLARKPRRAQRPERLASAVARATGKAFADVVRRRRAIAPADPATIHRTRIAFKKFRYMVESLSPDFTGLGKRELRALAHYQRRMGILQDLEVMQRWLAGYVRQHKGMEALLRPFSRHLRANRARALRAFLKSADELFEFWPPDRARSGRATAAFRQAA